MERLCRICECITNILKLFTIDINRKTFIGQIRVVKKVARGRG